MRRFAGSATPIAVVLLTAALALAEKSPAGGDDEEAVRKATASFETAFNRGDAKAVAAHWIPDGDLITVTGQLVQGRDAIRRQIELLFAERRQPRIEMTTIAIRFLTPEVAILDGTSRFLPVAKGPPTNAHHTIILVKRDRRWMFANLRAALSFPTSNYEHLQELEWLIGTWRHAGEGSEAEATESTWRWTDKKNFIIHNFVAKLNNQPHMLGKEVVAWDPRTKQIKSWVFESDGGIIQGIWRKDGDRWVVEMSGVLGDGTEVSAVDVLTPVDDDTIRFESTNRIRGGQQGPDRPPIELRRVQDER